MHDALVVVREAQSLHAALILILFIEIFPVPFVDIRKVDIDVLVTVIPLVRVLDTQSVE